MLGSVAVLVLPGVAPFELGVACEVFGIDRRDTGGPVVDRTLCTPRPGLVTSELGFDPVIERGLDATADVDLVVVPAYAHDVELPEAVREHLRAAHARGAWALSVCSGAFALPRAGLLDGRRCTTHRMCTSRLASTYRWTGSIRRSATSRTTGWSPGPAPRPASMPACTWCAASWVRRQPRRSPDG